MMMHGLANFKLKKEVSMFCTVLGAAVDEI
jgi:hypothetical protein